MKTRLVNLDKDYPIFESWWKERNLFVAPKDILTQFGMVAEKDGKMLAAMWLCPVLTSKMCLLRFPISDPSINTQERSDAVDAVILSLHDLGRSLNCKYVLCSTNHKSLIKRLTKFNYLQEFTDCSHMVGVL